MTCMEQSSSSPAWNDYHLRQLLTHRCLRVQKLDAMQARVAKLEAERLEMRAYFEQQQALVEEQEELTQQLLEEQAAIDAEMACLLTQRNQISSERAQLIIEFSTLDGERADLAARELELSVEANELAQLRAGLEAARLDLDQERAIFGAQDACLVGNLLAIHNQDACKSQRTVARLASI